MAKDNKEKKIKLRRNIRYRITVIDDDTHESLFIFKASKFAAITALVSSLIGFIVLIFVLIAYTPFRETIPGYPSAETKREFVQNVLKVDSLEREIEMWSLYLANIQRILKGEETVVIDSLVARSTNNSYRYANSSTSSKEDSLLREEVLRQQKNLLSSERIKIDNIEGLLFFTPIKGIITQGFNKSSGHPFIDIAASENPTVSSVLDGTIISATWNDETGYTIQIQHENDLISVYKHNVKLLKRSGERITAGTPIALVGDAGYLSTGPHLHFELWYKGEPIDPANYIKF